jgi:hypothetical protein
MRMHKCFTLDSPDGWIDCMCPIGLDHTESEWEDEIMGDPEDDES